MADTTTTPPDLKRFLTTILLCRLTSTNVHS